MAIFTAEEFGGAIKRCWLDGKDVTRLATRVDIPAIRSAKAPPSGDVWTGTGWVDILDTDDEGHIVADIDGKPTSVRHYGTIKLEWVNA